MRRALTSALGLSLAAGALGLLLCTSGAPAQPAPSPVCTPDGSETVTVSAVDDELNLQLADGRLIRLAGADPGRDTALHPTFAQETHDRLAAWLVGRPARLRLLAPSMDRWGRLPGLVFAPAPTDDISLLPVAIALIGAGLARARPESDVHPCWPALVAAETEAQRGGLGLWRDPYYAVRQADAAFSPSDATAGLVIVEGRIMHVGQTRTRLYLDLGPGRGTLSLRLAKRDAFIVSQLGTSQNAWIGRRVRARGVLDDRNGPQIDLFDRDQFDVLDSPPGAAGP